MPKAVTAVNHAQIDTGQVIFIDGNLLLDGDDSLSLLDSVDWSFGVGDFTVELWLSYSTITNAVFLGQIADSQNMWYIARSLGDKLYMYFLLNNVVQGYYMMTNAWGSATGTPYHIVFERYGTGAFIFINGVSQALTASTAFGTNNVGDLAASLYVGSRGPSDYCVRGSEDEVRISKGIARYLTNFTPPSAEYTPDGYTKLLLHCDGDDGSQTFLDSSIEYFPSISEALTVSDLETRQAIYQRSISEVLSPLDELATLLTHQRIISEALAITDLVTRAAQYQRSISETLTIADLLSKAAEYQRSISDSLSLTDLLSRESQYQRLISEALTVSDLETRQAIYQRSISEYTSILDELSRQQNHNRSISETISLSDLLIRETEYQRLISETTSLTDLLTRVGEHQRSISETLAVTDLLTRTIQFNRTISETLGVKVELVHVPELGIWVYLVDGKQIAVIVS